MIGFSLVGTFAAHCVDAWRGIGLDIEPEDSAKSRPALYAGFPESGKCYPAHATRARLGPPGV